MANADETASGRGHRAAIEGNPASTHLLSGLEGAQAALAGHGLAIRGVLNFGQEDRPPPGLVGEQAKAVLLVGNFGGAFWPHFEQWRREQSRDIANPLDAWSVGIIREAAAALRGRAVFPSERPYHPFQQWAMRAEGLRPSPLGILMHPKYGLWHAYRGAILLDRAVEEHEPSSTQHPCDVCAKRPCLYACPVHAHAESGFAYEDCLMHVRGPTGADCRDHGCLDRNACPVGVDYRYPAAMQQFLMRAFARLP